MQMLIRVELVDATLDILKEGDTLHLAESGDHIITDIDVEYGEIVCDRMTSLKVKNDLNYHTYHRDFIKGVSRLVTLEDLAEHIHSLKGGSNANPRS